MVFTSGFKLDTTTSEQKNMMVFSGQTKYHKLTLTEFHRNSIFRREWADCQLEFQNATQIDTVES